MRPMREALKAALSRYTFYEEGVRDAQAAVRSAESGLAHQRNELVQAAKDIGACMCGNLEAVVQAHGRVFRITRWAGVVGVEVKDVTAQYVKRDEDDKFFVERI